MLYFILCFISLAYAKPIQVGISESPPFSMQVNGEWEGLSVDLWEKIAEDNNWEYQYVETNLIGMLDGVSNNELDISISSLTITYEREMTMDFSTPYYTESIGVVTTRSPSTLQTAGRKIKTLLKGIIVLLLAMFGMGTFYYYLEKDKSSSARFQDWLGSCYWSLATMTTVGYGDEAPSSIKGRLFAMVWMVLSLLIFAWVMGQFAAFASTSDLKFNLNNPIELRDYDVATVSNSVSSEFLNQNRIRYREMDSINLLKEELLNPDTPTDFVIYDRTILLYIFSDEPVADVLDVRFDEQSLGFALQTSSPFMEKVNLGILSNTNTEWWQQTIFNYTN